MNKAELIDHIAKEANISKDQAADAMKAFTSGVTSALQNGDSVTLIGFGTFSVSERGARTGRNPRTGETLNIAARKVARFKPGKSFSSGISGETEEAPKKGAAKKAAPAKAADKKAPAKKK